GRLAARGTVDVLPGGMAHEWIDGNVEGHVLGQLHRKLILRHRDDPARITVNDRNRAAPVSLARDTPVAQTVHGPPLALADLLHSAGDLRLRLVDREAIEKARIGDPARSVISLAAEIECGWVLTFGYDNRYDGQLVCGRELEVALIVGRTAEDGTRAIAHQYEIGDEDRQLAVGDQWMGRREPRI